MPPKGKGTQSKLPFAVKRERDPLDDAGAAGEDSAKNAPKKGTLEGFFRPPTSAKKESPPAESAASPPVAASTAPSEPVPVPPAVVSPKPSALVSPAVAPVTEPAKVPATEPPKAPAAVSPQAPVAEPPKTPVRTAAPSAPSKPIPASTSKSTSAAAKLPPPKSKPGRSQLDDEDDDDPAGDGASSDAASDSSDSDEDDDPEGDGVRSNALRLLSDGDAKSSAPTATTLANMLTASSTQPPADIAAMKRGEPAMFSTVAATLARVGSTSGRLASVLALADLLRGVLATNRSELSTALHLASGHLAPAHLGLKLGVGDALLTKVVATTTGRSQKVLAEELRKTGDLGSIAQAAKAKQTTLYKPKPLTADAVLGAYRKIATATGRASMTQRQNFIQNLLSAANGPEPMYIIRALQGRLRIGLAVGSVLAALAVALVAEEAAARARGDGDAAADDGTYATAADAFARQKEGMRSIGVVRLQALLNDAVADAAAAYAAHPSLEAIAAAAAAGGTAAVKRVTVCVGMPFLPMLAKPANGGYADIRKRLGGRTFTAEFKYDGERAQVHYKPTGDAASGWGPVDTATITLFSRRCEDYTGKYPDVVEAIRLSLKTAHQRRCAAAGVAAAGAATDAAASGDAAPPAAVGPFILDGEIVPVGHGGVLMNFQTLQRRARKNVQADGGDVKVSLFIFDAIAWDGAPCFGTTMSDRRAIIRDAFAVLSPPVPPASPQAGSPAAAAVSTKTESTQAGDAVMETVGGGDSVNAAAATVADAAAATKPDETVAAAPAASADTTAAAAPAEAAADHEMATGIDMSAGIGVGVEGAPIGPAGVRYADYVDFGEEYNDDDLVAVFEASVVGKTEGLMLKATDVVGGRYVPGERSMYWWKLKKDYTGGAIGDSVDLVPIGAYYGMGKRTGTYGSYILACYDEDEECWQTFCKTSTGFSDAQLVECTKLFEDEEKRLANKPSYYDVSDGLDPPHVWLAPTVVWEVRVADLSLSPVHRAAVGRHPSGRGVGGRFPRLLRFRDDKAPTQATGSDQVRPREKSMVCVSVSPFSTTDL